MLGQLQHYSIAAGIIIGTRMHTQRVRTTRAGILTAHSQMVVVRTYHDILIPERLVVTRQYSQNVMRGALLLFRLPVCKIVIETLFFFPFDDGLQLQAMQLTYDKLRCQGVSSSAGISATQILRSQILYRLPHFVLFLCVCRHRQYTSQRQKQYLIFHLSCNYGCKGTNNPLHPQSL